MRTHTLKGSPGYSIDSSSLWLRLQGTKEYLQAHVLCFPNKGKRQEVSFDKIILSLGYFINLHLLILPFGKSFH